MTFDFSRDPRVSHWRRSDWEAVKIDVMYKALLLKFSQNPELSELLLLTGERELIEHSPYDSYWGDGGDGTGENHLGKLLMKLRRELRGEKGGPAPTNSPSSHGSPGMSRQCKTTRLPTPDPSIEDSRSNVAGLGTAPNPTNVPSSTSLPQVKSAEASNLEVSQMTGLGPSNESNPPAMTPLLPNPYPQGGAPGHYVSTPNPYPQGGAPGHYVSTPNPYPQGGAPGHYVSTPNPYPQGGAPGHYVSTPNPYPQGGAPGHYVSTPNPYPQGGAPGHYVSTPNPYPQGGAPGHYVSTPNPYPQGGAPGHYVSTPNPYPQGGAPGHYVSTPNPYPQGGAPGHYVSTPNPYPQGGAPGHYVSTPNPYPQGGAPGHYVSTPNPHPQGGAPDTIIQHNPQASTQPVPAQPNYPPAFQSTGFNNSSPPLQEEPMDTTGPGKFCMPVYVCVHHVLHAAWPMSMLVLYIVRLPGHKPLILP